jgi:hypothetical protein
MGITGTTATKPARNERRKIPSALPVIWRRSCKGRKGRTEVLHYVCTAS